MSQHQEFAVRADDGRIVFRSKPWAYQDAADFAREHGGTVLTRQVERVENATDWIEVSPEQQP